MTLRPEAIERMARAMYEAERDRAEPGDMQPWDLLRSDRWERQARRWDAMAALDALRALLAERGATLAPEEATIRMENAAVAMAASHHHAIGHRTAQMIWAAMLAAAPNPLAEDPAHG